MPGINQYPNQLKHRDVQDVATKAGVDLRNLSAALKGKRPMSLTMAKKTAGLFGAEERPIAFYVMANARVLKQRVTAGDGKSAALRGIAAVLDQLKSLTPAELAAEGKELEEAVNEMVVEVNATSPTAPPRPASRSTRRPRRSPARRTPPASASPRAGIHLGRKLPDVKPVARDPHGRAIREA